MTAQTATTSPETAVLRPYPLDQVWKRGGFYVARLEGPDPKYGVAREFLNGRPIKKRRTIEFSPADLGELPAWILRRPDEPCTHCGQTRPVRDTGENVIAAYASGWIDYGLVFGSEDLLRIFDAGPPGAVGAWTGRRCEQCDVTPVLEDRTTCSDCLQAADARQHLAALPSGEVF